MGRARHGTFIYQRPGSSNFYVRLRHGGKRLEKSLGTSDRQEALRIAWPLIGEHKDAIAASRPKLVTEWVADFLPGLHTLPDGSRLFADARTVHYLDDAGATIRTEPNGKMGQRLANWPMGAVLQFDAPVRPDLRKLGPVIDVRALERDAERIKVTAKTSDDGLLEIYIKEAKLSDGAAREARNMWALFRSLVKTPLNQCTRSDGRVLVDYLADQPGRKGKLTTASIHRKLVPLVSMCTLAIKEGKLKLNPFSGLVAKKGTDSTVKLRFTDDDMVLIRANLDKLSEPDRLLVRILATTGMRLSEPFQVVSEERDQGVRYVIVSSMKGKSKIAHRRRVPLPSELADLPKITGKLFAGDSHSAGKRIGKWLRAIGIVDEAKTPHCFRHRAGHRLDAAECPSPVRDALLGHGAEDTGGSYGADGIRGGSHPITTLKRWIDCVGM